MESRCRSVQPSRSPGMLKSFTLYVLKAVISGGGDEVVNLAKTYLWRLGGLTMAAHGILCECPNL
jgi:hypothetical protein